LKFLEFETILPDRECVLPLCKDLQVRKKIRLLRSSQKNLS